MVRPTNKASALIALAAATAEQLNRPPPPPPTPRRTLASLPPAERRRLLKKVRTGTVQRKIAKQIFSPGAGPRRDAARKQKKKAEARARRNVASPIKP